MKANNDIEIISISSTSDETMNEYVPNRFHYKLNQRRNRNKGLKQNQSYLLRARDYFQEYALLSGLHGLQYIGDRTRPLYER